MKNEEQYQQKLAQLRLAQNIADEALGTWIDQQIIAKEEIAIIEQTLRDYEHDWRLKDRAERELHRQTMKLLSE